MQKIVRYLSMAALAVVGAIMSSCTSDDLTTEAPQPKVNNTVTLTTTISLDGGAQTRALTSAGVKTFAKGDKIALIYTTSNGETVNIVSDPITAENIFDDGKKAKVIFDGLSGNPEADQDARLIYPAAMAKTTIDRSAKINDDNTIDFSKLAAQDGTLASLADNLDLCTWDGQLNELQPEFDTSKLNFDNMPNLTNRLTIGEFTIKESSSDITSTITDLTISDGTNSYAVKRTAGAGPIYVAMQPISSDKTVSVYASDGIYDYTKEVTGTALEENNFYTINVTTTKTEIPLTLEAINNANISFDNHATGSVTYRINGGAKQTIGAGESKIISVTAGQKVLFYGDNASYFSNNATSLIKCDAECYLYGNIMSLISSTDYATLTELTGNYTFYMLFSSTNTTIKSHPSKVLKLPATKLTYCCYDAMFTGCQGLTAAPELPAGKNGVGELADACYSSMFKGCTSLANAPALPATTLKEECYHSMFEGCTSLANAPALPATTLKEECYYSMFEGCTSLTAAPELPAGKNDVGELENRCYGYMFDGCTSLSAAPALPATKLKKECYERMFSGCTNLTTAPELPAGKNGVGELGEDCYMFMFDGCTSLSNAPELPATTLKIYCYYGMFEGCTSLTTAPTLPAETLKRCCYEKMFSGCISLTTAPTLPAKELDRSCYNSMFKDCTKLSSVSCYAKDISEEGCLNNWLEGAGTYWQGTTTTPALYVQAGLNLPRAQWNIPDSWEWYPSL